MEGEESTLAPLMVPRPTQGAGLGPTLGHTQYGGRHEGGIYLRPQERESGRPLLAKPAVIRQPTRA